MNIDKVLKVATYAGKILLESGAETYRVEETICRICNSLGMEITDSFVTPTGIIVSISNNDCTSSLVKRVTSRGVDLNKIHKINDLSRSLYSKSIDADIDLIYKKLTEIDSEPRYSFWTTLLCSSLGAGSCSLLFGGNLKDLFSCMIIGIAIKLMSIEFQKLSINEFFINSIGGSIAAFLAIILYNLGIASHIDKTIIGSIMLLVPGLAITNAVRDTIAGDYLAGITKAAEAFLVAISIAVGTGAILSIWINSLGGSI